jgi:hypothetical protein
VIDLGGPNTDTLIHDAESLTAEEGGENCSD